MSDQQHSIEALDKIISEKNAGTLQEIVDPRTEQSVPLANMPQMRTLRSVKALLDEYLERPLTRAGTATLLTEESFHAQVNRFKSPRHTALFADPDVTAPSVTAIFDYHEQGAVEDVAYDNDLEDRCATGWGKHRAILKLDTSDEWKKWVDVHEDGMVQTEFASFLQDRIGDLVTVDQSEEAVRSLVEQISARVGTPQQIMTLARGLSVKANQAVRAAVTLESGEGEISFAETHTDASGAKLTVPTLFYINVPVFYGGLSYRIPVRLRYRLAGSIVWSLSLYRHDKVFDHALTQVRNRITAETGLPVLVGIPEA